MGEDKGREMAGYPIRTRRDRIREITKVRDRDHHLALQVCAGGEGRKDI